MKYVALVSLALTISVYTPADAAVIANTDAAVIAALHADAQHYLDTRESAEHGATSNLNTAAGTMSYGGGLPVTPASLFQIGGNAKAFTAVTLLQLEAQGKLSIDQTVGTWLPQYPAWGSVSIRRLLDMTSDIPMYDDNAAVMDAYAANPFKDLSG